MYLLERIFLTDIYFYLIIFFIANIIWMMTDCQWMWELTVKELNTQQE